MKTTRINDFKYVYLACTIASLLIFGQVAFQPWLNAQNKEAEPVIAIQSLDEIIYIVKPGDSLNKIADRYKVLLRDLKIWNNIGASNHLHPGDEIIVKQINYEAREGLASWYGPNFHGARMANTEVFNMYDIVVAHRTLPLGRKVKITNLENGKSIIAPVLDRGPYVKDSGGRYTREIDLSYAVACELGTIQKGVVMTLIEPIDETLKL